jgi:hypothetical protein
VFRETKKGGSSNGFALTIVGEMETPFAGGPRTVGSALRHPACVAVVGCPDVIASAGDSRLGAGRCAARTRATSVTVREQEPTSIEPPMLIAWRKPAASAMYASASTGDVLDPMIAGLPDAEPGRWPDNWAVVHCRPSAR